MASKFPRRKPSKDWTTLGVRILIPGQLLGVWDAETERGFIFMHPSTAVNTSGVIGALAARAQEHPGEIVNEFTGPYQVAINEHYFEEISQYLDDLWNPVEVKVALAACSMTLGRIPPELKPKVFDAMERV